MARVATYVFIDLETTGLPGEELNKTRITELSMVAVKRLHLENTPGSVPRVQHKLTLCLYPKKYISDQASKITGLCNYLLEKEPVFDLDVFSMIDTFLNVLTKPVCLIAHNGHAFDFPILKNHLEKLKVSLSKDLLCADCFYGFYDILEKKQELEENIEDNKTVCDVPQQVAQTNSALVGNGAKESPPRSTHDIYASPSTSNALDEMDFFTANTKMQAVNESTPKHNRFRLKMQRSGKVCRRMPWGTQPKPKDSYKLEDLYEKLLKKTASGAHRAENDCIFELEISACLSDKFIKWVDNNHVKFAEINPMTIGVPL